MSFVSNIIPTKLKKATLINWIKRYIMFHHKRHPKEMNGKEIEEFLTHLAVKKNVAASTQNQALNDYSSIVD